MKIREEEAQAWRVRKRLGESKCGAGLAVVCVLLRDVSASAV